MDSDFWDREEIIGIWSRITGGSWCVDIRYTTDGIERELGKYVTKTVNMGPDQIVEYAIAMKSARLVTTTGTWLGLASDREIESEEIDLNDQEQLYTFEELEELERRGDRWASRVLEACDKWIWERLEPSVSQGSVHGPS